MNSLLRGENFYRLRKRTFDTANQGRDGDELYACAIKRQDFLKTPFFGVRQMTKHMFDEGHFVKEKRICLLMRLMALMPIQKHFRFERNQED